LLAFLALLVISMLCSTSTFNMDNRLELDLSQMRLTAALKAATTKATVPQPNCRASQSALSRAAVRATAVSANMSKPCTAPA
jgi:hypothetical protein